ncbi:Spi family protease inhibitor [Dysgonomonas reticulitermitis]
MTEDQTDINIASNIDPSLLARVFNAENTIGKDKALEIALSLDNGQKKSSTTQVIESIEVLRSADFPNLSNSKLKDMPDTVAYIVNYADNRGYTVVAADRRIKDDVISSTPDGNLHMQDAYESVEAATVFDYVEDYLVSTLREAEYLKDSLQLAMNKEIKSARIGVPMEEVPMHLEEVYRTDKTPYYTIYRHGPLSYVEWGQRKVFDDSVKYHNCGKGDTPVGCVPVMIAQVMSYYKYPGSLYYYKGWPGRRIDVLPC